MDTQGLQGDAGQPTQTTPDVVASQDDWAEAEEAYNAEPNTIEEQPKEQGEQGPEQTPTEQPEAQQADPVTPTEEGGVNLWNVDNITTPEQFKSHIKQVQAHVTKQNQAKAAELKEWREGYSSILQSVAEVAQNPSRLGAILQENAQNLSQLGIQVNPAHFSPQYQQGPQSQPQPQQPAYNPQQEQAVLKESIKKALVEATSGEELAERISDLFLFQEQRTQKLLEATRNGLVTEVGGQIRPFVEQTRKAETVNLINNELFSLAKEIPGFEKYEDKMMEVINATPHTKSMLNAVIQNPQIASQYGITLKALLLDAYQKASYQDRIEEAKQSAIKQKTLKFESATEKPGPYKQSVKANGEDWDEIESDMGELFVKA